MTDSELGEAIVKALRDHCAGSHDKWGTPIRGKLKDLVFDVRTTGTQAIAQYYGIEKWVSDKSEHGGDPAMNLLKVLTTKPDPVPYGSGTPDFIRMREPVAEPPSSGDLSDLLV